VGVLLTVAAIAISGSAGVIAERRWPADAVGWARKLLVISLYTLVPLVVFFNLIADILYGWLDPRISFR